MMLYARFTVLSRSTSLNRRDYLLYRPATTRERVSNYGDAKSLQIVLNERYAPDEREIAITRMAATARVIEIVTMN